MPGVYLPVSSPIASGSRLSETRLSRSAMAISSLAGVNTL